MIPRNNNKLNAKMTTIDGIKFRSQDEGKRYLQLKLLQKAGAIKDLELQHRYELQPAFTKGGKKYRAIYYVADFVYVDTKTNETVVEDVKGCKKGCTYELFTIKKKLFEFNYPNLTIREVTM